MHVYVPWHFVRKGRGLVTNVELYSMTLLFKCSLIVKFFIHTSYISFYLNYQHHCLCGCLDNNFLEKKILLLLSHPAKF